MKKRILVLGATGMLGQPVAHCLHEDGYKVRVLARDVAKASEIFDGNFEIVAGDVTDLESLEQAMDDCFGVHISVGGAVDYQSAKNVAALAPELGVDHLTYVSGSSVCEENGWFPMTAAKLMAEKTVKESKVDYTIFRPTWPMEQLPRLIVNGRATLVGDEPVPWHWFAADDLGRMVANAYQFPEALGKTFYIHGPELITMKEALEQFCQVVYPEIETVSVMPVAAAKAIASSTGNQMLNFFAELMDYFQKVGEIGDPTEANNILGRPSITLDNWIEQWQERQSAEQTLVG